MSGSVAGSTGWYDHARGTYRELQLRQSEALPPWAYRAFYPLKIAIRAVEEFQRNTCVTRAAGLAFVTLLALVPLSMVMFRLVSTTAIFAEKQQEVIDWLFSFLVPAKSGEVQGFLLGMVGAQSGNLTPLAWAMLVVTCLLLLNTIESTFNAVWGVTRARPLNRRIVSYWTVLTLPVVLMGMSFVLSLRAEQWLETTVGSVPWLYKAGGYLLTIVPTWLGFTCAYLFVPYTTVRPRAAFIGGMVAGTMWDVGKIAYIEYSRTVLTNIESLYGPLSTVPVTLIWIYVSWLIVIFGAEVSFAVQFPDNPAAGFSHRHVAHRAFREYYAVRAMTAIVRHYVEGAVDQSTSPALAAELETPADVLLPLLDDLQQGGLILLSEDEAWVPARPPDTMTAQDVTAATADRQFAVPDAVRDHVAEAVRAQFDQVRGAMHEHLAALTMTDLARRTGA